MQLNLLAWLIVLCKGFLQLRNIYSSTSLIVYGVFLDEKNPGNVWNSRQGLYGKIFAITTVKLRAGSREQGGRWSFGAHCASLWTDRACSGSTGTGMWGFNVPNGEVSLSLYCASLYPGWKQYRGNSSPKSRRAVSIHVWRPTYFNEDFYAAFFTHRCGQTFILTPEKWQTSHKINSHYLNPESWDIGRLNPSLGHKCVIWTT